jgi:hypothetical protein
LAASSTLPIQNLTPAVAHLERTKIYPLNGEAGAKPMTFPDASGVSANLLPISDGSVFDQLKLLVDREGAALAGPDWLGMLAAIGIVKGQPFTPDANTRTILDRAAKTAYKMSRVIGFEEKWPLPSRLFRPPLDQPHGGWNAKQSDGGSEPGLGECRWGVSGPRRPDLDVHRLLLNQPRDGVPNAGFGCQVHDCLHRWRRHSTDG